MVTCNDFYEKFERIGNFCQKSETTAKQIEDYISYRKRHRLDSFEINRCALYPFIMIEDKDIVHADALKELRRRCKQSGGRSITRKVAIEIINKANNGVDLRYKIREIPTVRSRMGTFEHTVEGISRETRDMFDGLKKDIGADSNEETLLILIRYCNESLSKGEITVEDLKVGNDKKKLEIINVSSLIGKINDGKKRKKRNKMNNNKSSDGKLCLVDRGVDRQ